MLFEYGPDVFPIRDSDDRETVLDGIFDFHVITCLYPRQPLCVASNWHEVMLTIELNDEIVAWNEEVVSEMVSRVWISEVIKNLLALEVNPVVDQPLVDHVFSDGDGSVLMSALSAMMARIVIGWSLPKGAMFFADDLNMDVRSFIIDLGIVVSVSEDFFGTVYERRVTPFDTMIRRGLSGACRTTGWIGFVEMISGSAKERCAVLWADYLDVLSKSFHHSSRIIVTPCAVSSIGSLGKFDYRNFTALQCAFWATLSSFMSMWNLPKTSVEGTSNLDLGFGRFIDDLRIVVKAIMEGGSRFYEFLGIGMVCHDHIYANTKN